MTEFFGKHIRAHSMFLFFFTVGFAGKETMDLEIHDVLKGPLFLGHGLQPCVNIFQDVRNDLKMVISITMVKMIIFW